MYEVVGESQKISRREPEKRDEVRRHNPEVKANITSSDRIQKLSHQLSSSLRADG
jgi:hypothetical protein